MKILMDTDSALTLYTGRATKKYLVRLARFCRPLRSESFFPGVIS